MKCILLILALVALGQGAAKQNGNTTADALEKLQGTWTFVALEVEGAKLPEAMLIGSNIIIKGDTFKSISAGITYEGTIKIDVSKTPKTLDLIFTDGPEKGTTSLGIYELVGDNLRICLSLGASSRPTEFATKQGSGHALETLKREKQ
jgi:uncharacterized protein (TIGR03067 family)